MTCIVGLVHDGKVFMGGDSAGVSGWDLNLVIHPKVFRNGECLIGYTSSFRMGQLLQYHFTPPLIAPDTDLMRYMATDFIDAVRACLKDYGYAQKQREMETGGCFLVGLRGRLFFIADDYQVDEWRAGYSAVGCGAPYAIGALAVTDGLAPAERITKALEVAESFSAGVRAPFTVEVL